MPGVEMLEAKIIGVILLILAARHALHAIGRWFHHEPVIAAYFSPKGGCTAALVNELASARREVLVQAYSFSSPEIANALIAAAKRRVRVVILLDRSNEAESYSQLSDLEKHGLKVLIDSSHAIAHNKLVVIDSRTVITGSFNFTRQAEHENAENMLILRDHRELATRYRANFQSHFDHCHPPSSGKPAHVHSRRAASSPH